MLKYTYTYFCIVLGGCVLNGDDYCKRNYWIHHCFLALETINWFVFTTKLMKYNFQKSALTEAQARAILKHVRFIYFWLSSSYYFNKLREAYYLVHSSGNVSAQTKEELRKSLNRRFVRGLPKVSVTN